MSAVGRCPRLLYGTAWKEGRTTELVLQALRVGYRGIDTACQPKHYQEKLVGDAVHQAVAVDGLCTREELYLQTKFTDLGGQDPARIPYDKTAPLATRIAQSVAVSLANLQTSYIDSLVLHSPLSSMEKTLAAWKVLEGFVDEGKIKQLGISNCYDASYLRQLYNAVRVKPAVLQNRFYDEVDYCRELRAFCKQNDIVFQSFWTLSANPRLLRKKEFADMAAARQLTPAQLLFLALISDGASPLTGTTSQKHMKQDLDVLSLETLSAAGVAAIEQLLD